MINNKYMVVTKFGFRKKKNQNKSGLVAHKINKIGVFENDKYFEFLKKKKGPQHFSPGRAW